MGEFFSEVAAQIGRLWQGLATWQRVVLGAVLVLVPLAIVWLVVSLGPNYVVLYANLDETDRLQIERLLDGAHIRNRVELADSSVWVDPGEKNKARFLLAQEGLPHVKSEGYAILDRQRLGATEFAQRLNYQRALEQELQGVVQQLESVRQARVLLTIPQPTVFTEREKAPTAAVLLTLKPQGIAEEEVRGIVHLVSNSVEGLTPDNVVVSDSSGRVISKSYDGASAMGEEQAKMREQEERPLEAKILGILISAYGNRVDGTAITSVAVPVCTARFDHDTLETETTTFDPESVVAKERIVSESSEGMPVSPVGVPGVTSNILGVGGMPGTGTYSREESTTEYSSGATTQVRRQAPKLVALATAVTVNSQVLPTEATARGDEMASIRRLINSTVGYDATATDGVIQEPTVEFISFAPLPPMPIADVTVIWWRNPLVIVIAILGLLSLALIALLLKPRLAGDVEGAEALSAADQSELRELLERQRGALEAEEMERRRRRREALIELADAQPEEIERVMRHWGEANE